jgi:hypothetical protein
MKAKDKETLWLYFTMAYEAATRREFDEALAHSQKAVDMITLCAEKAVPDGSRCHRLPRFAQEQLTLFHISTVTCRALVVHNG